MVRVLVAYDTKYGNAKLVAEKIAEGMRGTDGIETAVNDIKEVGPRKTAEYDAILIGAPVHFGGPSRAITRFIDKLGELNLDKPAAVFDTYLKTDFEKRRETDGDAIGKMAPQNEANRHALALGGGKSGPRLFHAMSGSP